MSLFWLALGFPIVIPAQAPIADVIFPPGGQAGHTVDVTISGSHLQSVKELRCSAPGVRCEALAANQFRLTIPAQTLPGSYDLWAVGTLGVGPPRTFAISHRAELLEIETTPNDQLSIATPVQINCVVNGRLEKAGDVDCFQFEATAGQRIILDCQAERIDSRLRAILEVFDAQGRRLAVNRGYSGIDPLIDFHAPANGVYVVRVQDLLASGGSDFYYRLELDTTPRVAFSIPNVIQRGQLNRVTLFGWNLTNQQNPPDPTVLTNRQNHAEFDQIEVEIPDSLVQTSNALPLRLQSVQSAFEGFAYHLPGSNVTIPIGITDVPVLQDRSLPGGTGNHSGETALPIPVPCEVSGQLTGGDESDWFEFQANRGEVFYIETLGQRIQSHVDLQFSILRRVGSAFEEIALFNDEVRNLGGAFPTHHLDPAGRWVCPETGAYLIVLRNLIGGLRDDARRVYRLSVRREEPDFQLVAVPNSSVPVGFNLQCGGRQLLELIAFRRRGFSDPIRVSAQNLPLGIECPDVWLGPGVERACLVVTADQNIEPTLSELKLDGFAASQGSVPSADAHSTSATALSHHRVQFGTLVRSGLPTQWGRLASKMPFGVAGKAPFRITANAHEALEHQLYGTLPARHFPGGVVDVMVEFDRLDPDHQAPVKLIGAGLPESIENQTAIIPAGQRKGALSFYLPPSLPVGKYSFVVRAETTAFNSEKKPISVTVPSNPITVEVETAKFLVEVEPFAVTRARRGEVIQIGYSARRLNGFIGKMHTELAAPGQITDVVGIRGRGETFVGQSETGSLQITINDDAPLGIRPFLRLFTVGVVEDQPVAYGSRLLSLEILE